MVDSQTSLTTRASNWSITINNPNADDRMKLLTNPRWLRMVRGQDEIGANGTEHLQVFANTDQVRMSAIKSWLPRAHIKPCFTEEHIARTKAYVHKQDETTVANTQFERVIRGGNQSLTMAELLMRFAEHAWTPEIILKMDEDRMKSGLKYKSLKEWYDDEYWYICNNELLAENPDLIGLLSQPQYLRAWVNTRQVWIKKYLDSQTKIPEEIPDINSGLLV